MQAKVITYAEVVRHIDSGQAFNLDVVACDVSRGTGGRIMHYAHCVKHMQQTLTKREGERAAALSHADTRHPDHFRNATKNIFLTDTRQVKKIHPRLIVRFNGALVS